MITKGARIWLAAVALAGTAAPAAAVGIGGLSALEAMPTQSAQVAVQDGRLRIAGGQGAQLEVTPWPRYLPQRFSAGQQVAAQRSLHPSGPTDRLELSIRGSAAPWLALVTGLRQGQPVLGDWKLAHESGRWLLRKGEAWRTLRPAQPAGRATEIGVDGTRWCVYLLEAGTPVPAAPGVAPEGEADADLALVRTGHVGCRSVKTGERR